MIQFFIENQEIIFPDDFSFKQIDENPLITNNGEFTLDITISLKNKENAKAAKFINRINKIDIETSYKALMIDDGNYKYGMAIIQSHTNKDMTFQFVSGNSELNYLAKNDKKIWQLDWGTETAIDLNRAIASISTGWTGNFICAPVKISDETVNDYLINNQYNNYTIINSFWNVSTNVPLVSGQYYTIETAIKAIPTGSRALHMAIEFYTDETTLVRFQYQWLNLTKWEIESETTDNITTTYWLETSRKIIMQPYLMYYIRKIPELLGYTLDVNVLENDSRAKKLFIINSIDSLNYADALPDMSITEFISSIEDFFNVLFLVDKPKKTISIHNLPSSISGKNKLRNISVLDDYVRDVSQASKAIKFDFTRVSYNSPDSVYFKYHQLSDVMLSMCEIKEFSTYTALRTYIASNLNLGNKMIIYRDLEKENDYFVRDYRDGISVSVNLYVDEVVFGQNGRLSGYDICLINKFKSYGSLNDRELVLNIVPSAVSADGKMITNVGNGSSVHPYIYQLPISSNNYFLPTKSTFIDSVENGEKNTPRIDKLEVAFFAGKIKMYGGYGTRGSDLGLVDYPFSFVDSIPEFSNPLDSAFVTWRNNRFSPFASETLRLTGNNGIVKSYRIENLLDTSEEYTFEMLDSPNITADKIFEYKNQNYLPISLERTRSKEKGIVRGKFYRLL